MRGWIFILVFFGCAAMARATPPPNILLILTDDQRADTLDAMPAVQALGEAGMRFPESFVPTALCCPSRVSLLTGQYAHRTGVRDNAPPEGGATRFDDTVTIATVLQAAGYATGYFGKYLNDYEVLSPYIPPGWTTWEVFVRPIGFSWLYADYVLNEDGVERAYGSTAPEYSTDLLRDRTLQFLTDHTARPWFAIYAPGAPHSPAGPAPRHVGSTESLAPWRPPSYGEEDLTDKPSWWTRKRERWESFLFQEPVTWNDTFRKNQLATLAAVDEAVGAFVDRLAETGQADRTVLIFTSDNGIAWGEHWVSNIKRCPYEECLRVPLLIRDPYGATAIERRRLVLNLDLAPTIAAIAGTTLPNADGASLLPLMRGSTSQRWNAPWRTDFLFESWNFQASPTPSLPPTHTGIRGERWKYIRSVTAEGMFEELYDLDRDRYELDGALNRPSKLTVLPGLRERLDSWPY